MVSPFLVARGFTELSEIDKAKGSPWRTIQATDPAGHPVRIRVKLCWYRTKPAPGKSWKHAAQFSRLKHGDWNKTVGAYVEGALRDRITHFLFIAREGGALTRWALVPTGELSSIWRSQRAIYNTLIKQGKLGRRKMNPAENGSTPTLYLQDDEAQEAVDAVWKHHDVQDVVQMRIVGDVKRSEEAGGETLDDLPRLDDSSLGSDGAPRVPTLASSVKRNQSVRARVLRRAAGRCERAECGTTQSFVGFFDVHHILGAEVSDRVYNCVALCPNCHREAHYSPNRDAINKDLLEFAMRFQHK